MSRAPAHNPVSPPSPPIPGKVLMFVRNSFEYDSRVLKQAQTLMDAGAEVKVVAIAGQGLPAHDGVGSLRVRRVDDDPVPTRLARRAIGWFASVRGRPGDAAERGAVIDVAAVRRRGIVALLVRSLLRVHLLLALQRWWREALAVAHAEPADVYVAHDLDALPIAVLAKLRLGGKALYDSHELWVESTAVNGVVGRLAWQALERRLIRRADGVITVSDLIAEELKSRYGVRRPHVVLNVPYDRHGGVADAVDLRARLGIPPDRLIALYLGGISPNRGIEQLIEAAALLDEELMVVLMGPTINASYGESLRALASRTAGDRVVMAPAVPGSEVVACAASADIGLVPQSASGLNASMGLPNKLFECIAAGLPIVANDLPALRQIVTDYEIGLLCDGDRPADIARAVRELASDAERRTTMADNARRASSDFTWAHQRDNLLSIFGELAAR